MSSCSACGTQIPPPGRFCSACGTPVPDSGDGATLDFGGQPPRPPSSGSWPKSSGSAPSSISDGLFLPGILLSGRYRIIALLGRGGMGEVYRADDLTLGQPVALKFLPDEAAHDQGLLERFHNEVRTARRVSHPNVCRVYDIGEVDGHNFFTMEYVDGEDLGISPPPYRTAPSGQGTRYRTPALRGVGSRTFQRCASSRHEASEHHAGRAGTSSHHRFRPGRSCRANSGCRGAQRYSGLHGPGTTCWQRSQRTQ